MTTTALVDLSNACRGDGHPRWDRYLLLRERLLSYGFTRVRAIGDSSLRFRLSPTDVGHLETAIGRNEVQMVPYADPHLISAAFDDDTITVVSNDRFRGLRRQFPELRGFRRVLAFRFEEHEVHLHPSPLEEDIDEAELSRIVEAESLTPLGYSTPEDRDLLRWDWRCLEPECGAAQLPQLDELPLCDEGNPACPICNATLERLGLATGRIEIKVLIAGEVRERFALAVGSSLRVGRGPGPGRFDVSPLLEDPATSPVSRIHLEVTNHDGRLRICDLASRNGTEVAHADGTTTPLREDNPLFMGVADRVSLAGAVELQRSGRRWPRAHFLDHTVVAAPSPTARDDPR